ncbi:MAG: hypothetical protein ACRDT6_18625 [Micromonosporaceae bacterium]
MTEEIMPGLPAEGIDANAPHVRYVMTECRACGDHSHWAREDDQGNHEPAYAWMSDHSDATRHSKFYVWSITRNTARTYRL